jgi:hypothetical protein
MKQGQQLATTRAQGASTGVIRRITGNTSVLYCSATGRQTHVNYRSMRVIQQQNASVAVNLN